MARPWWSSKMMALEGGYFGLGPPPTKQKMLQRNSISTMPMPPSSKSRRSCSAGRGRAGGVRLTLRGVWCGRWRRR